MFRRADFSQTNGILSYLKDDAVSVRIKGNLSVYKTEYAFAEFWAQYDENEKITAVLSKINGECTLVFSDGANKAEIIAFLNFVGYNSLFLDAQKADALGICPDSQGDILCFDGNTQESPSADDSADMKAVFELISENEGKNVIKLDYLEWLSDFTFKSNRDAARLKALTRDGTLVSFAMTSAETENSAIISGVFTKENCRRQGMGKRVLTALCQTLVEKNKKVYILTAEKKMTAYYEKAGFKKVGRWCGKDK